MSNDVSKLPVWAQKRIRALEYLVKHLTEQIQQMGAEGNTRVYVTGIDLWNDRFYLPDTARIIFRLDGRREYQVQLHDDRLDIIAHPDLAVTPQAANHITLFVKDSGHEDDC